MIGRPTRRIFREMPDVPPRPHPDEIWLIAKGVHFDSEIDFEYPT